MIVRKTLEVVIMRLEANIHLRLCKGGLGSVSTFNEVGVILS